VVWGKRAEALGKFLSKGARLFIEGANRTTSYNDRDGNKRHKTEVVAKDVILCDRGAQQQSRQAAPSQQSSEADYSDAGEGDDDIPF
jgi:single-strand DNA-binding protein